MKQKPQESKNHCKRLCTKYKCINLDENNKCIKNKKKCDVFLMQNGKTDCKWEYHDQPCRYYYWCYLDYKSGIDSPVKSELNNAVLKKYGREL